MRDFHTSTKTPRRHADPVQYGHHMQPTTPLAAVREWVGTDAGLLVLSGHVGTGKTLAAAWGLYEWWTTSAPRNPWGNRVLADGRHWVAAQHLARMAAWSQELSELEQRGMLVVDDIGEEDATPKALAIVSGLLTARISEGLRTIITTNLDGATFRARYGERLIDRLRECGLDDNGKARWWIKCTGESLRGRVTPTPVDREEIDDEPEPERYEDVPRWVDGAIARLATKAIGETTT